MKTMTKLWVGIGVLSIISPVGLFLPAKLKAGSAWGEWSTDEIKDLIGYIPCGLEKLSLLWNTLLPDYAFNGWDGKGIGYLSFAYIVSAVIGIVSCIGCTYLLGKLLTKKES